MTGNNYSGKIEDGKYIFPQRRFIVDLPFSSYDVKIQDSAGVPDKVPEYADFTYDGYWSLSGLYSVEIRHLPNSNNDELLKNWEKSNAKYLPEFIKYRLQDRGIILGQPVCANKFVKNRKAYECTVHAILDVGQSQSKEKWKQIYSINDFEMLKKVPGIIPSNIISTAILFEDGSLALVFYANSADFKSIDEKIIPPHRYENFISSLAVYKANELNGHSNANPNG